MSTQNDSSTTADDDLDLTFFQISILLISFPTIILTVAGNLLVILSWFVTPSIRSPSNALLIALAIVDLLLGLIVMPLGFTYMFYGRWIFGDFEAGKILCKFQMTCNYVLTFLSANHLVLIALDRYRILFDGTHYLGRRKLKDVVESCVLLWILALWTLSPVWLDWENSVEDPELKEHCIAKKSFAWVSFKNLGTFIFPIFYLARLYLSIFLELRKRLRNKLGKNEVLALSQISKSELSTEAKDVKLTEAKTPTSPNPAGRSFEMKLEVAPSLNLPSTSGPSSGTEFYTRKKELLARRERKSTITLGVLIGAFYLAWLPCVTISIIHMAKIVQLPKQATYVCAIFGWFNSTINPIVYAVRNPEFKEAFRKIWDNVANVVRCTRLISACHRLVRK